MTEAGGLGDCRFESRPPKSLLRLLAVAGVLLALILAVAGTTILDIAGRYLAPRHRAKADAVIIEGAELLKKGAVADARRLMSEEHIERLILVSHKYPETRMSYAVSGRYDRLVGEELEKAGLGKGQYILVSLPVAHPVTLIEARAVMDILQKESIRSAVLVAEGFHTRRSYLLYRNIGRAKGIHVMPWSSSASYPLTNWWHNADAVYDFTAQLVKLAYYLIHGYIPVGSLLEKP